MSASAGGAPPLHSGRVVLVAMVDVGPVNVLVDARLVGVRVAVCADHREIVMMVVVTIVMVVSVLMRKRRMRVAVRVLFRQVKVDPDAKEQRSGGYRWPRRSVAERPRHSGPDEWRYGKDGPGTRSANHALGS